MPFHKLGENAKALEPTGAKLDYAGGQSYKVNSAEAVSDDVINSWFNEAFLSLKDDPYIHMKMGSTQHRDNLFVFNAKGDELVPFRSEGGTIEQFSQEDKRRLFEASQENQLFYYDPSLGKNGGMRQIYTKTVDLENGKKDLKLLVTEDVKDLPTRVEDEPKAPTWWTYVKAFFRVKSARQEVEAYDRELADYNHSKAQAECFKNVRSAKLSEGTHPQSSCKAAKAERTQRIKDYEANLPKKQVAPKNAVKPKEAYDGKLPYEKVIPTPGLKEYNKQGVEMCFARMTPKENQVPKNDLSINALKMGALISMAVGSPDLTVKLSDGTEEANFPDANYDKIVGNRYIKNSPISRKSAEFLTSAYNAVTQALEAANNDDFEQLGKLVAEGLIQNNRVLKAHKQLTDVYTAFAQLGGIVLDIMRDNPNLEDAVRAHLGDDADKQFNMANAARNIAELRVDAMKIYQKMGNDFHLMSERRTEVNGKEVIKKSPIVDYSVGDVTKIALLSSIEVDMNAGKFDLENSQFADPDTIFYIIKDYEQSEVMQEFLLDEHRAEIVSNPIQMQNLFNAATDHMKDLLALKKAERELGVADDKMYIDQVNIFGQEKQEQGTENLEERFDLHEFIYNESADVDENFNAQEFLYEETEEVDFEAGEEIEGAENADERASLSQPERESQGGRVM